MKSTAKIFSNGRSQAVQLPRAFRLKGTEVSIRKEGEKVILEPLEKNEWPEGFWDLFKPDPDFDVPDVAGDLRVVLDVNVLMSAILSPSSVPGRIVAT